MSARSYSPHRRSAGFTLIELLVVLLIIGLSVGLVTLQVGNNDALTTRNMVKQFANNAALLAEEAIVSGQQWGIDLYRAESVDERFGYRWLLRKDGIWSVAAIEDMDNDLVFPAEIVLRFELENVEQDIDIKLPEPASIDDEPLQPDILLLSSGEMTPFVLSFAERDRYEADLVVRADLLGRIELETAATDRF